MPRAFLLAGLMLAAVSSHAAFAAGADINTVYFWENERTFGWSPSPYGYGVANPQITKPLTIEESCGRQVGRRLQTETDALVLFTRLVDACVKNGGRL